MKYTLPVFLFSVLFSFSLLAKLEDHFKPVLNKEDHHSIRNIDFIYMINLDERPEKFKKSCEQLHCYGVFPYRFSAVNGWKLSLETINDIGVKYQKGMKGCFVGTTYVSLDKRSALINTFGQTYFCHDMSRGAIGCALSHLSILQDAFDSGYETIWVMEDDIHVVKDPNLVSALIDKLDTLYSENKLGNWDIFFTDPDTKDSYSGKYVPAYGMARRLNFKHPNPQKLFERVDLDSTFRLVGARFGAYSMIVRRSGIEKLLKYFKKYNIFFPFDMDYHVPPDINLVTLKEDLVTFMCGSATDNAEPTYLLKLYRQNNCFLY